MVKGRISSIENGLLSYRTVPVRQFGLTIMQGDQRIDLETLSTSELFEGLQNPSLPKDYIPSIMAYIVERPKEEVCLAAKQPLEQSDSLIASAATCGILMKVLGDKAPFLQFEQWIQACENE